MVHNDQHAAQDEALSVDTYRLPFRAQANLVAARASGARNEAAFLYHLPERA